MNISKNIGSIPSSDSKVLKRERIHQGWWRAFVLNLEQGEHPHNKNELICSSIPKNEELKGFNFITPEISAIAESAINNHKENKYGGLIEEKRLRTNLLSSQPLCINFFGFLAQYKELGLAVAQYLYPEITEFHGVHFEYAPTPKNLYTNDNSAFDVALLVSTGDKKGIIGIECKYTERFSQRGYSTDRYREIYNNSKIFTGAYEILTTKDFNQLFRNQLLAESLIQSEKFDFAKTALFCNDKDFDTLKIASKYKNNISTGFEIITYFTFIELIQKMNLTQPQREYTMLLWARYMGHQLSDRCSKVKL